MFTLENFYKSKEWATLTQIIRAERLNDEGLNICAYCGKPIVKAYDCICHHIEHLTEENVNDVLISLNPDNIQLVHHKCHNIIHNKFGHSKRGIYLVYGSPFAGKRAWVDDVKSEGDLIIDIDSIWECVSGCNRYTKPNRLKAVVFGIRDRLLEDVRYRRGRWLNAYIIGTYPLISERERLVKELGAEEVFVNSTKGKCLENLMKVADELHIDIVQYSNYICEWFDKQAP